MCVYVCVCAIGHRISYSMKKAQTPSQDVTKDKMQLDYHQSRTRNVTPSHSVRVRTVTCQPVALGDS